MPNQDFISPSEQMLLTAKIYRNAGLSVMPIVHDSKKPVVKWKRYENELINEVELARLYRTPFYGKLPDRVAVIGGPVSGNLELLDFDVFGIDFDAWEDKIPADLNERLLIERTPNDGLHVAYRCEKIEANQGLCYRWLYDEAKQKHGWKATIETRGIGGYCVVSPSDGYAVIQGDWTNLPVISPEERDLLINAARSLDRKPKDTVSKNMTFEALSDRPGDLFNTDPKTPQKLLEILLRHGWALDHETEQHWFMKHPGNCSKEHSTTLSKSNGFLHTFSPNTPFEQNRNTPPFEVYTLLEADGDFTKAASKLAGEGFAAPTPTVDLSALLEKTASASIYSPGNPVGTRNIVPGIEALGQFCTDLYSGTVPLIWDVGLGDLNHIELAPNRILVFGGAPGSGKTALTMQLAIDALALNPDLRLIVANVEMSPAVLLERQVARFSGISLGIVQLRKFTPEQQSMIAAGIKQLESLARRITFVVPPIDLKIVAEAVAGYGGDIIILDYLQRIPVRTENQHKELRVEMNRVMDSIRVTASTGRCVIGLSSLNRAAGKEGYDAGTLTLSSFKESGEIEYGADDCFGVCFGRPHESGKLLVPIKHLKSRHHERCDFDLLFDGALQSFGSVNSI